MLKVGETDYKSLVIGILIFLIAAALIYIIGYSEYKRNQQDIETDEEIDKLKAEIKYWKYLAEHPQLRLTLEGEGWEDIPDEYK